MAAPDLFLDPDRCPVCGFRPRNLLPKDGVRTVRSLPHQWREALTQVTADEDSEPLVRRPLGAGPSALGHAMLVTEALREAADQLQALISQDHPTLEGRTRPETPSLADDTVGAESVIKSLADAATRLVGEAEGIRGRDWLRPGVRAGRHVTALELLRRAVHEGTHRLAETNRGLARLQAHEAAARRSAQPSRRPAA